MSIGAIEGALDVRDLALGLERAEAGRRQVAGDAAHAGAVGPVGGELHLDDRIGEAQHIGVALAELAAELGRQLDDALVVVGELQLPLRYQHALGDDAAHGPRLERDLGAGDIAARGREHADHAGLGIGGAAHHLDNARAGIDRAHLQLVGVGMPLGLDDAGDGEGFQLRCRIVDAFDIEPDQGQLLRQLPDGSLGVEMIFQPGQCEFHVRTIELRARRATRQRTRCSSRSPIGPPPHRAEGASSTRRGEGLGVEVEFKTIALNLSGPIAALWLPMRCSTSIGPLRHSPHPQPLPIKGRGVASPRAFTATAHRRGSARRGR